MPLYSDPGYFYSTGSSSGLYSSSYSAPYYTTSSPYIGSSYGRPYSIPTLSSYSSSSRYQPKLSTITETPLTSRSLIPLTRLNSPKIITTTSYHHPTKYIPPRPININTADIDVSASRYRRHDFKSPPKTPTQVTTQVNEPLPINHPSYQSTSSPSSQPTKQSISSTSTEQNSPFMPRADSNDAASNRSTIKRNRAVIRLSTVRSKSIRNRSIPKTSVNEETNTIHDDCKKPKIDDENKKPKIEIKEKSTEQKIVDNVSPPTSSWRDKFGDDLVDKPYGVIKKSPGELLLERHIIPSKYKDEIFVNSIDVPPKNDIDKSNNDIIIEFDPIMQSEIRRLSIPKCPDFQDFCEDISSDKIDDDLNAGELRRRASLIQEQEIELFNQLQKSASGSFQLIHLERNESNSDINSCRKSTKRNSSTKKPKKIRHKITATVDVQNPTLTPILQETFEDDNSIVVEPKNVRPKFTFNVDEIEENHTIHKVFKLPKKKSIEKSPKVSKTLENIELKKGIKNSPKKIKVTKKTEPVKGVKSSPTKIVKSENEIKNDLKANQLETVAKIDVEIPKSKTIEEISIKSPIQSKKIEEISIKSPIKISSKLNVAKIEDISSQITAEHFKFDQDSITKTESQSPIMRIKKPKQPISPLTIDNTKDTSPIAQPKPIVSKIQRSDSGEDFWTQIGTRETLYMNNRKINVLESQWLKRETLLDNQSANEVKNLEDIKTKVHDQKNEALKEADKQNQSAELGKRAHSNESTLCTKKKGLSKDVNLVNDSNISKNIENKNIVNEIFIAANNNEQIKSKEILNKIPDNSETLKKINQPLQSPTPTDSEKINNTKIITATTKLPEKKPQNTTTNIPKIATGLKAKSPEIKSKEIDLNKNKLDPQKSAPPSPVVDLSVDPIKTDVASKIEINILPSKSENNKTSPKLTIESEVNNKTSTRSSIDKNIVNIAKAEQHESKENISLQKLKTTTSSSSSSAAIIIDDNKQQKKVSPPTTLKSSKKSSPIQSKLSPDTKISLSLATDKNQKLCKEFEKVGKIPDKNICDANSIDKIEENITNKNEGNNIIKKIENHQHQQNNNNNNEKCEDTNQQQNKEQQNQQHEEEQHHHQLSCKNVLMKANLSNLSKFATVNNLSQCLLDVDADIEDIKSDSERSSSYSSYSSDNNNNKTDSMKRKDKKNKHNKQPKEEKQFNRNKVKLDHTKKCYVKDEAPRYPLIATPRPLWKPEKFIIQESDTDDDSDTDNSDNDGSDDNGSDNDSSTSSGSTDDEFDNELNPNKSAIIRMSTCSNDSGFEGGTAPSSPKKMLGADARDSPSTPPSHNPAYKIESNNDDYDETSYTYAQFQKSGRITAPATNIPRFKKYSVEDFHFLTVLGKGSFGKVLLAELRNTDYYYAVKCLKKDVVLEDDDVECTLIERKVLALGTKHPYLCHLFCTFQTESHLFFVMEYLNGGDLMFHIQQSGRFPEPRARFYAAEIISGLKFLHKKGIIYRDLKLDNVLLDFDGHVRIADFGMCKLQIYLDKTADSFCGTPDYMAPEIIKGDNYNQNVDWWSFGVLLYEMLIGQSPFSGCDEEYLFWSICNEMPLYPLMLSQESTSLLKALLEKDSNKRIGSQYSPAGDICGHPFFYQIEWDRLEKREIEPPFKPQVKHPLDTQYFDKTFTRERVRLTPIDKDILQSMDQAQFQGFSYTNPNATIE